MITIALAKVTKIKHLYVPIIKSSNFKNVRRALNIFIVSKTHSKAIKALSAGINKAHSTEL